MSTPTGSRRLPPERFRPSRQRFEVPPEPTGVDGWQRRAPWDPPVAAKTHPVQTGFMLTVGVGIALLGYYVLTNVGGLIGWIVTAAFISLGLDPLVRWLESKRMPRALAAAAVITALALVVTAFILVVVPRMVEQAQQFVARGPQLVDQFMHSDLFHTLDERLHIADSVQNTSTAFQERLATDENFLGGMFGSVVNASGVVLNAITGTLIVMALTLYFLFSLPTIKAWCYRLAPGSKRARVTHLGDRMTNGVGNYVMGQACVALINATVAFVLMNVTGVPYASLLVLFVGLLAFVPLVGGVLAGVLVSLVAILGGWDTVVPYAVCYFAYLQLEAYVVSPRIMARAVAVPGAVAVIAVAAGGALWGILGALIAIPTAAAGLLLVREVFVPRQDAR
ncbi:AI-2E family transporter [Kocuria sp.]|uniref:AI-2E family transporter n=1 Tax=Kocuria sp. TaxID=1871328 RepID=UPI0026DD3351|nr:AI-2E family transporter [Kocuria sp.]MDO4918568.1 AI-2E family transporter [Kocuria sp.]